LLLPDPIAGNDQITRDFEFVCRKERWGWLRRRLKNAMRLRTVNQNELPNASNLAVDCWRLRCTKTSERGPRIVWWRRRVAYDGGPGGYHDHGRKSRGLPMNCRAGWKRIDLNGGLQNRNEVRYRRKPVQANITIEVVLFYEPLMFER
jgi:hypothetical protein